MSSYEQRSYPGAAAETTLLTDITSGATAFSVAAGTGAGYPDGSNGPFFVIIDWDNSKAEKIRCSARSGDAFTVAPSGGGRGQDATAATGHSATAKIRAVWTATDATESNRAVSQTVGQIAAKGDLLLGTGANTLGKLTVGTDGQALIADSSQATGARYGAPAASSVAGPAAITTHTEALTTIAASGAASNLDLATAREFKVTLTANCTFTFTNVPATTGVRLTFTVVLKQDATGSRTVTWPASVVWGAAGAPLLTTTAAKSDVVSFFSDDQGTTWFGFLAGKAF